MVTWHEGLERYVLIASWSEIDEDVEGNEDSAIVEGVFGIGITKGWC
jgi:hypothetical protein